VPTIGYLHAGHLSLIQQAGQDNAKVAASTFFNPNAMQRTVLHSKIHRATVTGADVDYVGSISLDSDLMQETNILPWERVQAVHVDKENRLIDLVPKAEPTLAAV
jgi:hypothetical protein